MQTMRFHKHAPSMRTSSHAPVAFNCSHANAFASGFIAFAKTVFGEETLKSGIDKRKEEVRHI